MDNRLREALAGGRFAITVEVVAPAGDGPFGEGLAAASALARAIAADDRVVGLSVTDRVRTDDDYDPVRVAAVLGPLSGKTPIVHLAGKGRRAEQVAWSLGALAEAGIDNVLCVTGDRLKTTSAGPRDRYLDSVDAVRLARSLMPSAFIAAGVSPFKYTEEEAFNQYLKMSRKRAAGTDYLITQVGWDMRKLAELRHYRWQRGFSEPVIANLMALSPGMARRMNKGMVPGIVVTDDLLTLVEHEGQAPDKGRRARVERLALQIVGAELLGYAGVELSGITRYEDLRGVFEAVDGLRARGLSRDDWWHRWDEQARLPSGEPVRLHADPGYFMFDGDGRGEARAPRSAERRRFFVLRALHRAIFHPASPVHRLLRPLARRIPSRSRLAGRLAWLEGTIKKPLGCEVCGMCRLPHTFYVCPETCPKGLANGPCGGSSGNVCEAGDRECVHSTVYRLAKAAGQVQSLERGLIPAVPEPRGGSSWLEHFSGRALRRQGGGGP